MRRLRCAWATAPAAHFLSERPVRRGATRSRARSGGAAIALAVRCVRHLLYVMGALSPSFPGGLHASAMAADGHLRALEQHNDCCCLSMSLDTLAERLRRRPAKPMGSPCVGSNPTGVVFYSHSEEDPSSQPLPFMSGNDTIRKLFKKRKCSTCALISGLDEF